MAKIFKVSGYFVHVKYPDVKQKYRFELIGEK